VRTLCFVALASSAALEIRPAAREGAGGTRAAMAEWSLTATISATGAIFSAPAARAISCQLPQLGRRRAWLPMGAARTGCSHYKLALYGAGRGPTSQRKWSQTGRAVERATGALCRRSAPMLALRLVRHGRVRASRDKRSTDGRPRSQLDSATKDAR